MISPFPRMIAVVAIALFLVRATALPQSETTTAATKPAAQSRPSPVPAATASATATPLPVPAPQANPQQAPVLGQLLSSAESDYVLAPGDTIEMTIFREPDLTTRSSIARDGTVQMPLIQEVVLAGLTVRDGRNLLKKLYGSKYLVDPQVYLNVVQFAQRKFTIMGQVARPGTYDLQGAQTLDILEAVGMAGGFTRIANRGQVIIKRRAGGKNETIKANVKRMAEGKTEPIVIVPGDVITVGESWF